MRDMTFFIQPQQLDGGVSEATEAFQMDQDSFRALYENTARPLWVYLWRKTRDAQLADDLLQDTYYRFLRARTVFENDAHRKNYLFRIAANLANDAYRRGGADESLSEAHEATVPVDPEIAARYQSRSDLARAMAQLKPRQRDALWLAYAEGSTHQEIAKILGVRTASVKLLLFRARRKLASLLRGQS
jgi:RNA polymerase sigma-70 factor (ECF subfamily)